MNPRIATPIPRTVSILAAVLLATAAQAADTITLTVDAGNPKGQFSPMLYGIMTEEINYSYDGGIYAELIQNRIFKDAPRRGGRRGGPPDYANVPDEVPSATVIPHWSVIHSEGASGEFSLDTNNPANTEALTTSLKLNITSVGRRQRVGVANDGYWGIPVHPGATYRASFYAKASEGFSGPLTVDIESADGSNTFASATVRSISSDWAKYDATLKTSAKAPPTKDARFVISGASKGTLNFTLVSLFPPTYNNRPNGNRKDIMQLLADMKPAFLRFPGGNYVEGQTYDTRFNWKITVGNLSDRPTHFDDAWGYRSSDGMGLLEFLEWCEDLHMKPVLAVYAAYSMRSGAATNHMDECIQDALDEIEYVTGETTTQWGAQRERDGHKKPFDLEYVEVGNEDNLGSGGRTYNQRFTAFHDAIKAKYPNLKLISTATSGFRPPLTTTPDVIDDHYYRTPEQLAQTGFPYDRYSRTLPKIFVGEYASQTPGANRQTTPCLADALGDAAFLTSLERNSDVVIMSSYAPLFVNINPGGTQWQTDLIGYDALSSYGSPSYYVQKIFNLNHGDTILNVSADHMPTYTYTPPAPRARRGGGAAREPQPIQIPTLHFGATRDRRSGLIYLKIVNPTESEQSVDIKTTGVSSIAPSGKSIVITGTGPLDTNAINDPVHIVPVTTTIKGVAADFTRTLPPYSATVLVYRGR